MNASQFKDDLIQWATGIRRCTNCGLTDVCGKHYDELLEILREARVYELMLVLESVERHMKEG